LPLVSYGGSSPIAPMASMGLPIERGLLRIEVVWLIELLE
jgi:cell division protein FtsW (lipid II flippase)